MDVVIGISLKKIETHLTRTSRKGRGMGGDWTFAFGFPALHDRQALDVLGVPQHVSSTPIAGQALDNVVAVKLPKNGTKKIQRVLRNISLAKVKKRPRISSFCAY